MRFCLGLFVKNWFKFLKKSRFKGKFGYFLPDKSSAAIYGKNGKSMFSRISEVSHSFPFKFQDCNFLCWSLVKHIFNSRVCLNYSLQFLKSLKTWIPSDMKIKYKDNLFKAVSLIKIFHFNLNNISFAWRTGNTSYFAK